jgi:homocysteine S-methyltransferase
MTGPSLRNARELLDPERVVVFDGATGTMLYAKGVFINQCYDQLNTTQPDLVREVHRAYLDAGAEVVETNSFGANRLKLAQYGLESHVEELNARAAELAREAAGDDAWVAGAVGPLGVRLEPYGPTSVEEARAIFREQLAALRAGGADLFILETFADLSEIEQAVLAARDVDASVPLIAQMTIGTDGLTPYGASPEDVARALTAAGVDVVGLNCSVGPQGILEAIERMAAVTTRKLSAMPNAGMPREVGGRSMYMASPEYLASYGRHLLQAGVKLIGGCCGTSSAATTRGRTRRARCSASSPGRGSSTSSAAAAERRPSTSRRSSRAFGRSCRASARCARPRRGNSPRSPREMRRASRRTGACPRCRSRSARSGRAGSRPATSCRRSKSSPHAASMRRRCFRAWRP